MREDAAPDEGDGDAPAPEGTDFGAALDALRARGATRADAVRLRFLESMARRSARHVGAARKRLDDRLAGLIAASADDGERGRPAPEGVAPVPGRRGPLADLVDRLARPAAAPLTGQAASASGTAPEHAAPTAPRSVEFFRRTWSRLSAEQRLVQSQSALPENAGPLHSHHLVHRSLTLMRDLAPDYFERFVAHVDALLWLELANGEGAKEAANLVARAGGPRKAARGGPG